MMQYQITMTSHSKILGLLVISVVVLLLFSTAMYITPLICIILALYLWLWVNAFYVSQAVQQLEYEWIHDDVIYIGQTYEAQLIIYNHSAISLQNYI